MLKSLLLSIAFLLVATLQAQPADTLTLREALDEALKNNLRLQQTALELRIAESQYNKGNAGLSPIIEAYSNIGNGVTNARQQFLNGNENIANFAFATNANLGLTLSYPLYDGGTAKHRLEELMNNQRIAEDALASAQTRLRVEVADAYYRAALLQQLTAVRVAALDFAKERLTLAKNRLNVGAGLEESVLQAQIDLNIDSAAFLQHQQAVFAADLVLLRLMGRTEPVVLLLQEDVPETASLPSTAINPSMLLNNPERRRLQLLKQQNENSAALIKAEDQPRVFLNAGAEVAAAYNAAGFLQRNFNYGPTLGLSAAYTLFDGRLTETRLTANWLQGQNIAKQVAALEQELSLELARLAAQQAMQQQLTELEYNTVAAARLTAGYVFDRFRLGAATDLEVRDAQLKLVESETRYLNSRYTSLLIAIAISLLQGEDFKGE